MMHRFSFLAQTPMTQVKHLLVGTDWLTSHARDDRPNRAAFARRPCGSKPRLSWIRKHPAGNRAG